MPELPAGRPAIVFTNHPSWWDPAMLILLSATLLPERVSFGPMEQGALGSYGVLRRMGVFGIDLTSPRGAARFMDVSLRVLSNPANALWITAEGQFTDARARPLRLRPGLAHLARRIDGAMLIPLALEYPFWNERKPEALARFGAPIEAGRGRNVAGWTATLEAALAETMDGLAIESGARDPDAFATLAAGGSGVGGVYDIWRRARAMAHGRRPALSHEEAMRRP